MSRPPALLELPCPFISEFGVIRLLEPADSDRDALLVRLRKGDYDKPFVIDDGDARTLYFSLELAQSVMRIAQPVALELAYTRAMAGFLFFVPQPRRLLLLGLGGGSLAKFVHRHLPEADLTAVEISADVIAFRDQFCLPPDDGRFRVVCADAAAYLAEAAPSADVILVDAFDRHGAAPEMCTLDFFESAHRALSGRGVMVVNLACERRERLALVDTIRTAFADNVLTLPVADDGNTIVFAFRDPRFEPRWRWIESQAKAMGRRYGLDFPALAAQLERSRKSGYLQRQMID